jgi:acetylornithine deacetylase/succinyl-diaminopimelate desuccinylase-like protein
VLDRAPTAAERRAHDRLASWVVRPFGGVAARAEPDSAVGRWVRGALRAASGSEPVAIRMMGGTVPTGALVAALGLPFVILPLANADDNQHTHDENLRVGHLLDGVEACFELLTTPYPAGP